MDQKLMQSALQSVLGEGYETRSRTTGVGEAHTPTPHDFLQGRVQKNSPSGGDMHVPTTIGADKPKKKGKLKAVEYVGKAATRTPAQSKERAERIQTRVAQGSNVLGLAAGGLGTAAALRDPRFKEGGKAAKKLVSLGYKLPNPVSSKGGKVGAALAGGALLTQGANIVGDGVTTAVLSRSAKKQKQSVAKSVGMLRPLDGPAVVDDEITFSKVDDDKMQVFGWCSIAKRADGTHVVDLQGDLIEIDEIEKSAYNYMLSSRKGGNQHARTADDEPVHVGSCIESMVFTPEKIEKMGLPEDFPQGWWYGMQIHDDEAWADVKAGRRKGFSVHGKGRRTPIGEEVSKAKKEQPVAIGGVQPAQPGQAGFVPRSRKERLESMGLGTAGAAAAGAGLGAALVPLAAKKGLMGTVRAERAKGKLLAAGGAIGGVAGVYSGTKAAGRAAKEPVDTITEKTKKKPVVKAWTPEVDRTTSEVRRERRSKGYQIAGNAGAAAAAGGAVHQLNRNRKSLNSMVGAETVGRAKKVKQGKLIASFGRRKQEAVDAHGAKVAAKPNRRGVPQMDAGHAKALKGMDKKAVGERRVAMKEISAGAKSFNRSRVASAGTHTRNAGKLGLAAVALGAGAEGVRRKRQDSWRPYPGVR